MIWAIVQAPKNVPCLVNLMFLEESPCDITNRVAVISGARRHLEPFASYGNTVDVSQYLNRDGMPIC